MNDNAALNLIKNTFENSFDRERFLIFAKNLFHFLDTDSFIYRGNLIPDAYDSHIKTLERLGKYEDVDGHKIEVLAVCLNKQSALERARTLQRNFIAWYLNGSRGGITKDAALVAFYTKDSDDWRLSLVKMDYHLGESKAGKIKAITELTPARRFSFLVGASENTHTAQRQLLPILKDTDFKPALSDLESAFSVEVVTKDFFEKYKKLFLDTKEALDAMVAKDDRIKADFKEKNIDTTDFAKKLLGQIVFLYFLQKKGWFGVARDAVWGTGPKDFLRRLFEKQLAEYDNFFNNILEPLFYEALAVERTDDFYSKFNCKIPFLNGGLFDPLGNYDWVHTDIRLPDDLFSNNRKTKEGDTGDGILDVFDRYNFTVKEDEPLEREVAVDPEMLGKVFENLLEVKDRKSKGTYYTPREIVHYMCQESLINYLLTELDNKVKRDDIETLIRLGETAIENEALVMDKGFETKDHHFKLPQSIRDNATLLDEKLEKIHVCDPAVGSGAFLVGMMTEVIRVRNILTRYLADNDRSIYNFKRHAIQNCLYGVDIDPGAVEIAKLRLWLSLIVDEQDIKQIKPLPNLDYKIMQGNSLLEEYEGIKLFESEAKLEQQHFFDLISEAERITKQLQKLKAQFFKVAHKTEKDEIKREIENLTWDLIEASLKEQKKLSLLPEIERFKKANIKPFFLWKLNFSEVFEKNRGFDIVIANPPYIVLSPAHLKGYHLVEGNNNTYVAFLEMALRILCDSGVISYIIPTTWLAGNNFREFRKFLLDQKSINQIVQLPYDIFEAAYIDSLILITNGRYIKNETVKIFKFNIEDIMTHGGISLTDFDLKNWTEDKEYIIFLNNDLPSLLRKYRIPNAVSLGTVAKVQRGTLPPRENQLILDSKNNNSELIPWFSGQVFRYFIDSGKKYWVKYSTLLENKPRDLFSCKKIFGRQLISRQFRLQFAYSNGGFAFKKNLYAIYNLDVKINRYYLLTLLNSKFYSYIQVGLNSSGQRDDYPALSLQDYKNFLIPLISPIEQKPFIEVVDKILALTNSSDYLSNAEKQARVKDYEKQIDQLVYKLYGLTSGEIEIIESLGK